MATDSGASKSKAESVRDCIARSPKAKPADVVATLALEQVEVTPAYVREIMRGGKSKKASRKKGGTAATGSGTPKSKTVGKRGTSGGAGAAYPRHALDKALRIPAAILDQNAGNDCTEKEAARLLGVGVSGPFRTEISSALKFGLLQRPRIGLIGITDLVRRIQRPQRPGDEIQAMREAVLKAPVVSDVYNYYRGENIPDETFFDNTVADRFAVPADKVAEFRQLFFDSLTKAQLIAQHGDKRRVVDASQPGDALQDADERIKKLERGVTVSPEDTCFVMMPFAEPYGGYYSLIYEPAVERAGLRAVRADDSIFGAGKKIMDQVWQGITAAKVLVAELTAKNPNVFYEFGLAHALKKPVVLVSADQDDVPFDLHHIRVIYYDITDPFWGQKLIDKITENILSAIQNPEEAIFQRGPR